MYSMASWAAQMSAHSWFYDIDLGTIRANNCRQSGSRCQVIEAPIAGDLGAEWIALGLSLSLSLLLMM